MVNLIQDIWIIAESGVVVFHRVFDEHLDAQLFGGLMTALTSFAEKLSKGGLTNFELNSKRFSVIKKRGFLFIANSSKTFKIKKVVQELDSIMNRFFEKYPEEVLYKFDGNIKQFIDFEKEIENSLQKTIRKFQKAFW
jgi:hypothetical protein